MFFFYICLKKKVMMFMAITVAIVGSMLAAWDFVKVSVSETIKLM